MKRLAAGKSPGLVGRTPTFSADVEAALVTNVQGMLNQGANLKADEVLDLIAEYLHKHNIGAVFKEGRPGKDWLRSFLARNKLSLKKPVKEGQVVMTICRGIKASVNIRIFLCYFLVLYFHFIPGLSPESSALVSHKPLSHNICQPYRS